jgi:hypothetical protein
MSIDPGAGYAEMIGEEFVRVRGAGFDLSALDTALIAKWFEDGIPLHIPINVIKEAADYRRQKCPARRIRSLCYFQEEVEARFAEWREMRVGAH